MSVQGDIHVIQDRILRTIGKYVQFDDIKILVRRRKTQTEELRGQVTTLETGADGLEESAEDLEQRIAVLEA